MRFLWMMLVLMPLFARAEGVPKAVAAQVQRDVGKYIDDLAVMIDGFGTGGAIDGTGLQNVVAMARAEARATALRRLQGADLDGDGSISGVEMRVKAQALAAAARGRLMLYFAKADRDADDAVSAAELQAYATATAQVAYSDDKAAAIYAILGFDSNHDGQVTLAEAETLIALSGTQDKVINQLQIEGHDHGRNQDGQSDQPVGGGQGSHLLPTGGEHDQWDHRKAQLQA